MEERGRQATEEVASLVLLTNTSHGSWDAFRHCAEWWAMAALDFGLFWTKGKFLHFIVPCCLQPFNLPLGSLGWGEQGLILPCLVQDYEDGKSKWQTEKEEIR